MPCLWHSLVSGFRDLQSGGSSLLQKRPRRNIMASANRTNDLELLRLLFEAHRDNNDELFQHAAQALIGRELSANHHAEAQKLIRALGRMSEDRVERPRLSRLPSRSLSGSDLVSIVDEPRVDRTPVLSIETESRIRRLVLEHRERDRLALHALAPKQKVLFWGPPGSGKTMTASLIAHELQMPLGILNLPSIVSSLLGGTSVQLKSVFDLAESRRMVLLLDEFDTLAKERDDERDIGESKRIVNTLLQLMERFSSPRSLIIAATNHQYALDRAIWRRFDDVIHFPLPGDSERLELLRQLLSGVQYTGSLLESARAMRGLSHADISRITTEALRTMVLSSRKRLDINEISDEAARYNAALRGAHNKTSAARTSRKS
jgi:SpoVK/Ycf46/Vps4 family AAA+-type ATPase